ncbi:CTP synthase 1-B [Nymphon striatum]|nr:CTP synthase 1-B [Nymphon striatum]
MTKLDPSFAQDFCIARIAYQKGIRNAKSIFIKKQSEDLIIKAKEHGIKALFRHVKRKTPSSSASIQAMYQHCKNLFTSEEPLTPEITKIPSCENENHPLLFTISLQEVEAALKQARSRACSISGYLSPHSLKLLLPGIAPILHILFNHFLVNSTFPSCWLETIFFFLHKKGDRNEPSNYRTIAIENPFLKVFMLWLTSRLSSFCESENILPDMQFGFRHNRSCISATSMLHHVVHSRLSNKKRTYAAFIDFSRAFDSIDRSLLFTKLQILGIPFLVCKLLHHILFNLKYRIRQDSLLSASFQCDKGTPQGDPLSPLLFSLFLADLPDYLDFDGLSFPNSSVKIHLLMYADDIVLLAEDANQLQTALDCRLPKCSVSINGHDLERVPTFVYLGIVFTPQLSFTKHIERCVSKANARLGICYGFHCAVIEFARNVLNYKDAHSLEVDKCTSKPVIIDMPEHNGEIMGGTMRLGKRTTLFQTENSILRLLYGGVGAIQERHRHRYEVNPEYVPEFEAKGMKFCGRDEEGKRMEIMELEGHPYYVGVQFHPEYISRPMKPSPPYLGLILASSGKLDDYIAQDCRLSQQSTPTTESDNEEKLKNFSQSLQIES